ncbi:muskelin [Plutella xylostella]|uniref:muskelin n=1 Tax=Plutella xylostella TaxID=51655 RepID=UPI0020324F78|nr:muskelin [Plutella xylostella]
MAEPYETVKLNYTIHKFSSYSADYIPENISVNNPTDQLSRWFTDSNTPSQYIMLKLTSPAVVETIMFGKYMKAHVSDLKRFKVLGGTDDRNMSELLSAGLKNDSAPETFHLRHRTREGLYLPVTYIKILPLQSWGPAYNFTIWYVELHGKNHPELIKYAMDTISLRKEEEAVRILLKHLRRRRYKDAFEALSRESGVRLEGPTQAKLWNALVENGDYELTEKILDDAIAAGELDWYVSWQPYSPRWKLLSPCSAAVEERLCWSPPPQPARRALMNTTNTDPRPDCNGEVTPSSVVDAYDESDPLKPGSGGDRPGPRGGHQLVVDPDTGNLYLFGGWNGTSDLDDLWCYEPERAQWSLRCAHSGAVGGPAPRSCHKMALHPSRGVLYTLGRYLDNAMRVPENMKSDLYSYSIESNTWQLVCEDTAAVGGPRLVFDHQMCIDADSNTIYVFGGRVLPSNTDEAACPQYSGLYAYYIDTDTWELLLDEQDSRGSLRPRVGHSMLFHPIQRRLYIFAGQRNKEHLVELWWYDVNTGQTGKLGSSEAPCPPPAAGFTQRATLDPHCDDMFVLSGMSKEKDKRVHNALWVFSLRRLTWSCLYRSERARAREPRPRFAHQLVLDVNRKVHYLFGGNPGNEGAPRLRLDDLWALELVRPSLASIAVAMRVSVREACYRSLCASRDPRRAARALPYLRRRLHSVLDHSDEKQVQHFQKLPTLLFAGPQTSEFSARALSPAAARRLARRKARTAGDNGLELSRSLAAVLGADDTVPELPEPFEELEEPTPDTWDVGDTGSDDSDDDTASCARAARVQLYDKLCQYFRPSVVPPQADITDLVTL